MSKILGIESLTVIMLINMFDELRLRTFLFSKAIDLKYVEHIYITQHSPPPPPTPSFPLLE